MTNFTFAVWMAACLAITGCSKQSRVERTSQQFNSLPRAVQQAVRSQAPNAEIASVDRKIRNGTTYYVVEFKEPGRNPRFTVAENGTVLGADTDKSMGGSSGESGTSSAGSGKSSAPNSSTGAPQGTLGKAASTDLSSLPEPVQKTLKSKVP